MRRSRQYLLEADIFSSRSTDRREVCCERRSLFNPPTLRSVCHKREATAAWRLFRFNWLLLAGVLVAFGVGLLLTNFHVRLPGYLFVFVVAAVYGLFGYYNAVSPQRGNPRLVFPLTAIAQMILVISVMTSISYIATAANLPLMDATLLAFDRALGFDFRIYLNFINDRQWLIYILAAGYGAIAWANCVIVVSRGACP